MTNRDKNEDSNINNFQDMDSALRFLIKHKGISSKKIDKSELKNAVDFIFKFSVTNGLSVDLIKSVCNTYIFDDAYDIPIRRKLLYSCVPKSEFPYQVIPLAISCATLPEASSTWQQSILTWLSGLLEYHMIEESNRYIHICYTSLFNMLDNIKLCGLVCKILYQITRLEDVTSYRTKILLKLERKNGFSTCVSRLIRIYKFFRPDLIVSRLDLVGRFPSVPKWYQESLLNSKARFEEEGDDRVSFDQELWPTVAIKKKKLNPYHENEVVSQPEILLYSENIEEKKEKKISVLQYKSLKDMIKDLPYWKEWRWPNSYPCLLRKPIIIPLFKPHDPYVKVAITNWLELALRTEVIEQLDKPSMARQEHLLDTCIVLVKRSETLVPAVFHFLVEFFTSWDNFSHMNKVLNLLAYFPFISPTIFFESVFEKISFVLTTASLPLFCAFINAFGKMASTWALQAQTESDHYRKATDWPFDINDVTPLEGLYYLTQRLERVILGGILRFGSHCFLLNTSISYYWKVNMCCENLQLPLFFSPPVELIFIIFTSADIVATHRMGLLLARLADRVKFVKKFVGKPDEKLMSSVVLSTVERINISLLSYLDTTVSSIGFCERWQDVIGCYVGPSFYAELKSMKNISSFGSICCALPYLPLSLEYHHRSRDFMQDKEKRQEAVNEILLKLKDLHLEGIVKCAKTYMKH